MKSSSYMLSWTSPPMNATQNDFIQRRVTSSNLQQAEKANAGDEFEFEHHIVTVEEFKGTVVQDLSSCLMVSLTPPVVSNFSLRY